MGGSMRLATSRLTPSRSVALKISDVDFYWFRGWNISATVVTQQRGTGYQDRMFRIQIVVALSHGSPTNNHQLNAKHRRCG
jgi:hypothetical protein